ncbi:hypothetical protein PAP18089_04347 [Pandoraea apista]|uniref:Uncharacterized protein n=1 Tax=Pandoraea apista TaxID=93218 RepID=A0A5E5PAR8_9BURK|nr:hypothetical protein PAP18089_04347 [Pandoraea apista]
MCYLLSFLAYCFPSILCQICSKTALEHGGFAWIAEDKFFLKSTT